MPQTLVPTDLTASSVDAVAAVFGRCAMTMPARDRLSRRYARHDLGAWSRSWAPTRRSRASKTH
jgi:hypothetical protein